LRNQTVRYVFAALLAYLGIELILRGLGYGI